MQMQRKQNSRCRACATQMESLPKVNCIGGEGLKIKGETKQTDIQTNKDNIDVQRILCLTFELFEKFSQETKLPEERGKSSDARSE